MRTAVMIPCYNEEANVAVVLSRLSEVEGIEKIFVISASNDATDCVVKAFKEKVDDRVELIHDDRRGKTLAMNIALELGKSFERIIFMGGDNIPMGDTMERLLEYKMNDDEGLVGVCQIPVDDINKFLGFCTKVQWNIHNEICESDKPKLSGELFMMKTGVLREMPPAIINDDLYIQTLFEMKGFKTVYMRHIGVHLKGTGTILDFLKQRIRVYIGHHQIRLLLGKKESTSPLKAIKLLKKSMPYRGKKGWLFASLFVLLQGFCFVGGYVLFHLGYLPYRWSTAKSTKELRFGV